MALLHRAEISPTKLDLLAAWLPGRRWFEASAGAEVSQVGAFRFDDPAGEVGIETILVRAGAGPVHQVPLTYRGAPLAGADGWLVGTVHHSVLGPRWVYDGCGDPVYAAALADAILSGSGQAREFFEVDGERRYREPSMTVAGSGTGAARLPAVGAYRRVVDGDPALILTDAIELVVRRRLDDGAERTGAATLTGTWPGRSTPVPLAYATPR